MYCMEKCLEQKLCQTSQMAGVTLTLREGGMEQKDALVEAVDQLQLAVTTTSAGLDNCFVFTLENRNSLMHHIADVKEQASRFGCGYIQELCALAEIITMILFRSHHYRDRQGLEQIEQAVLQMQICCTEQADSQSQNNQLTETVECLWRWVDANTFPGTSTP